MPTYGHTGCCRVRVRPVRALTAGWVLAVTCAATVLIGVVSSPSASAAEAPVRLGSAADFAILAGTTVTNAGASSVTGDIGVSPGSAVTGFPPGQLDGQVHSNDGPAVAAKSDLQLAYTDAVSRTARDPIATELAGTTLTTGVYESASGTFGLAGTLTLDGEGDPNAVFIFKTASTLITGALSAVNLINGAQSCNVYWQVGSSATLGAASTLRGNLLAFTSITVGAGVAVDGRTMAINGAVTLDTDTVTASECVPGELSISVPEAAELSSARPGGEASGSLGEVTVLDQRGFADGTWTATVVATNFVTVGPVTRTIPSTNVSCWSGPATETIGTGTFAPGQLTRPAAQQIDIPRTSFSLTGGVGTTGATWEPGLVVRVPLATVAATYTATVTFSVA